MGPVSSLEARADARRDAVRPRHPEAARTSIIIPAFNEAAAIGPLVRELSAVAAWHEILVIDDGSIDDTDGQHRPADALRLVSQLDTYDLVVGARSGATQAGVARRLGNATLNAIASYLTEQRIPDLTSGFRAARRDCLREFLYLLPNGFSTPTTTTLAFMKAGYSVRFEPVDAAQRQGTSKIRLASDGVGFFMILLKVITIYSPLRIFLPISAACFAAGASYALWTIRTQSHVTNSSVLLILLSVVILLVGLVSEQISMLRFEGRS